MEGTVMDPSERVGDVYPSLTYDDAPAAVEWLCRAFGFTRRLVVPGPDERIVHSELTLGGAVVMVSSPKPEAGRVGPRNLSGTSHALSIRIEDPDAHYQRAKAAGAVILRELEDEEYGSRGYMAKDLEGHVWYFGTYRPGAYWGENQ
jgi:uncharacterized glyoxalase superfamily protein PhnB